MNRFFLTFLIAWGCLQAVAQGSVRGRVLDKSTNESLQFVNVKITQASKFVGGTVTDATGQFEVGGLKDGQYLLTLSYVGYKPATRKFAITKEKRKVHFQALYLSEDRQTLKEVTVTGQRSEMKLEVDRKSFSVDQQIANAGGTASDVLENIPSVEIDQEGTVSLRGNSSVEVWINGKASGLTSDNRGEILQQMPAESIEKVEIIDNPSSKYSAEGTAGIINIVLKKNRKAGYYGSVQAGANTSGGYNASGNFNYSSSLFDAYVNLSYRHRQDKGGAWSRQTYYGNPERYQNYDSENEHSGSNVFTRFGGTLHATKKDDITLGFMGMMGNHGNKSDIPYHYGYTATGQDYQLMTRHSDSDGKMRMMHGELGYKHSFSDKHFIDLNIDYGNWRMDDKNTYQDSTYHYDSTPTAYTYAYRPQFIRNHRWEVKLDYENQINEHLKLQAGYNGDFSHENTPQESWADSTSWAGTALKEDQTYFNRFIYTQNTHALYAIGTYNFGKFGVQAGLRGEYWTVNTESYSWAQEHDASLRDEPFKKSYFQLFPSLFLSWQLTKTQQLQLNYTRRLRRPWGGELNSFKNTRDATMVSYGNPLLTPEYTHSFSLNYLKTWEEHTLSVSAYYRPTTDVRQRITYQGKTDGVMYQTTKNVAKSQRTGIETVLKNRLFRRLDLTSTVNLYYYHLDGFSFDIDGQTVRGASDNSFTWSARVLASLLLPYDISLQTTFNYRSREVVSQGYRKPNHSLDLGLRKTFFNKALALSINCRNVLNSRAWETISESDTFYRHQKNWRSGRRIGFTLTWNFGNMTMKKRPQQQNQQNDEENETFGGYEQ